MASPSSDRPIIVLGCPRSGTTLLQVMLHSHPRIAIPPETRFLLPAYRNRLRFGSLEVPTNRRALGRFIARTRGNRFGDLGLDRRRTIRQIVKGPPSLGSALGIVFRGYAERFDRPRWGDKRPAYHHYIDYIMRLFPDAQIVHIVRDPRDCAASITRMPWWNRDTYHAASAWAQSIDHTDEAARKWPGAVTRVQYELLVADPETELKALCAALGEEYDPAMSEPERVAPTAVPDRKFWHGYTHQSPTTQRVGRWRADLEPWEVALCETVLADRMQRFGYELSGAGRPPFQHIVRFARVHAARKALRRKQLVHDRWIRRHEQGPVAAQLTGGQRAAARL